MQDLTISLVQSEVIWEEKHVNLDHFSKLFSNAPVCDLLALPEMFNTGFSMEAAKNAETMDGETVNWMKKHSSAMGIAICGSMIIEDEGKYYNRFVLVQPSGEILHYDKRHLFSMAGEDKPFSRGQRNVTWEIKGWKIRPQVCYDLRFPVWQRNRKDDMYDVLLYSANWPTVRIEHWKALLVARAIENQCYVAAVSRIGEDGAGISYNGNSTIIDFNGNVAQSSVGEEGFVTHSFSYAPLAEKRESFPVLNDADQYDII